MLHTRFNMLMRGYVFCHLEPPNKDKVNPIVDQVEFVSFLVYNRGRYVGYVNPYGEFRLISDGHNYDLADCQEATTIAALFIRNGLSFLSQSLLV